MTAGTAGPATGEASASWQALGTGVQLIVTDAGQLDSARGMLEADLAAVDLACSRFRPDSEIAAVDRAMAGADAGPVAVSPLLAEAIAVALRAARLTDGDVDPTVGAAMNAVGYDRDFTLVQPNGPAVRLSVRTSVCPSGLWMKWYEIPTCSNSRLTKLRSDSRYWTM